jgi:hypothetical protein
MNYYYLIASLPGLSLETPAPFSLDQFRALGQTHLAPTDQALLESFLHPNPAQPPDHPFCKAWRECETRLRNAIAKARATRRGIDPTPHLRPATGIDLTLEKNVAEAFARSNPADRELDLDRIRWRTADELTGFNPFAFDAVLAYAIKLGLVARWQTLTEPLGRERVERILTL